MSDNPLETDDEFSLSLRNPNPSFRALKSGDVYRVDFELSKEEWEYFTDPNIDRAGMVLEMTGMVTHRASKQPYWEIPRIPATPLQGTDQSAPVKGGKWSQEAGKMCNSPLFLEFLRDQFRKECGYIDEEEYSAKADFAAEVMKYILGIESRKDLDTQDYARKLFKQLMHDFNRWSLEKKDGH